LQLIDGIAPVGRSHVQEISTAAAAGAGLRPSSSHVRTSSRRGATSAGALGVLAALAALVAGPGHRFGLWPLGVSFALLQAGFWGSFAAAIVSAAALIVARPRGRRRGMLRAFAGLAIGLVVVGVLASVLRTAMALPPIHDITTDPEDPPEFQAIVPLRVDAPNPIDYPGAEVAAQQEDSYPDIQPLLTERAPEEAFARARGRGRSGLGGGRGRPGRGAHRGGRHHLLVRLSG
jgi:hypothetical protein